MLYIQYNSHTLCFQFIALKCWRAHRQDVTSVSQQIHSQSKLQYGGLHPTLDDLVGRKSSLL